MAHLPTLIHDGAVALGTASVLYASSITVATLTALLTSVPARRRAAIDVLAMLLRRRDAPFRR